MTRNQFKLLLAERREQRPAMPDLSGLDLSGCDLRWSDLSGCNLHWSDFRGCNLSWCNFRCCDLRKCDLSGCDLRWSDLSGCNLHGANLSGCNLQGAKGILSFGPMPTSGRMVYAVRYHGHWMVKAGCFWGTAEECLQRVQESHNCPFYTSILTYLINNP
jgi:hypothetical protein